MASIADTISSIIFTTRNVDKAKKSGLVDGALTGCVIAGHTKKAFDGVMSLEGSIMKKGASSAVSAFQASKAGASTGAKFASASLNFASKAIDPLIVASSVAKVVTADSGERADVAVEEGFALTGMFTAGKVLKQREVRRGINRTSKYIEKVALPGKIKFIKPVVKALTTVMTYILGSGTGRDIGEFITGRETA